MDILYASKGADPTGFSTGSSITSSLPKILDSFTNVQEFCTAEASFKSVKTLNAEYKILNSYLPDLLNLGHAQFPFLDLQPCV